jgi:iron donor protein CyaY
MTTTSLQTIALTTMESLADKLEANKDLDVDYNGKMLSIELNSGQVYLINFHEPTNQLWLASPVSGAHHFSLKENQWQSTRDGTGLNALLAAELKNQFGCSLDLSHA